MKRFWEEARAEECRDGWHVLLDMRPVRTPAGRAVVVPLRALAEEIVAEWEAQTEFVNPLSMPMTRYAATCLDRVAPELDTVAETIAAYGETDLLCYRADFPEALVSRQNAAWDPMLEWASETFDAKLNVGAGVMHIAQPPQAVAALRREVIAHASWSLTALADLVTISGSLVLGLAVARERLGSAEAWRMSRIDEQWNVDQWGEDHDAAEQAARRESDFQNAARLISMVRGL